MRYKLICCEVFLREACLAVSKSPLTIDPDFTPKAAHDMPEDMRKLIQTKIDEADNLGYYDGILLGYGLCGNGTVGLKARSIPLVIPRAHDCCTVFLGSREKFLEFFKDNLSAEWTSVGYMERGESITRETDTTKMLGLDLEYEKFVELYGEENAKYLWETLHPESNSDELIYIDTPATCHLCFKDKIKDEADKQDKTLRILPGNAKMIDDLIMGDWDEKDFLMVKPGEEIKGVYDQEKVMTT